MSIKKWALDNDVWRGWRYEMRYFIMAFTCGAVTDSFWAGVATYIVISFGYGLSEHLVEKKRREDWNDAMRRLRK